MTPGETEPSRESVNTESPEARETIREFRRRRVLLVPFCFLPLLAGVSLVSVGLETAELVVLGLRGYTWAILGLALIAVGSGYLGLACRCPVCGKGLPVALLQGHEGEFCTRCGATLI